MTGKGFVVKEVARGFTLETILTATAMESEVSEGVRLDACGQSV